VTEAWGANTFPVCKQLPNPHFQNTQTIIFWFFLTFFSNKRWWRLHVFSFDGRCTHGPHERPFSHPYRRAGRNSWQLHWGLVRELGRSVSVQCCYHDFFFIYVLFPLLFVMLSMFVHNICYVIVFGVCLSIDYIHSQKYFFYAHMASTPHTHIEILGPTPGSM